jgi:hypothetical protein
VSLPKGEPLVKQLAIAVEVGQRKLWIAAHVEDGLLKQAKKLGVGAHPVLGVSRITAAWILARL